MLKTHSLPRETETAKKAGAYKKTGFGLFEFPNFPLVHFPIKFFAFDDQKSTM